MTEEVPRPVRNHMQLGAAVVSAAQSPARDVGMLAEKLAKRCDIGGSSAA